MNVPRKDDRSTVSWLHFEEREFKFLLDRRAVDRIVALVAPFVTLDVYNVRRPVLYTRTTYLDTEDRRYFRSSAEDVVTRLRIREYASSPRPIDPPDLSGDCFFEVKSHVGSLRTKLRFAGSPEAIEKLVSSGGEKLDGFPRSVTESENFRYLRRLLTKDRPTPCLTTFYRRVVLVGNGEPIRLTIDEGVRFSPPTGIGYPEASAVPRAVVGYVDGYVLEAKVPEKLPSWFDEALGSDQREIDFSKFRTGMHALDGGAERLRRDALDDPPIEVPSFIPLRGR